MQSNSTHNLTFWYTWWSWCVQMLNMQYFNKTGFRLMFIRNLVHSSFQPQGDSCSCCSYRAGIKWESVCSLQRTAYSTGWIRGVLFARFALFGLGWSWLRRLNRDRCHLCWGQMLVSLCLAGSCSQNWYVRVHIIPIIAKPMCHNTINVFFSMFW